MVHLRPGHVGHVPCLLDGLIMVLGVKAISGAQLFGDFKLLGIPRRVWALLDLRKRLRTSGVHRKTIVSLGWDSQNRCLAKPMQTTANIAQHSPTFTIMPHDQKMRPFLMYHHRAINPGRHHVNGENSGASAHLAAWWLNQRSHQFRFAA